MSTYIWEREREKERKDGEREKTEREREDREREDRVRENRERQRKERDRGKYREKTDREREMEKLIQCVYTCIFVFEKERRRAIEWRRHMRNSDQVKFNYFLHKTIDFKKENFITIAFHYLYVHVQ